MENLITYKKADILKDLALLTIIISIFFSVFLGSRPLMVPDEGRYAEIPREMVSTGNYLTPHLNGLKYFEKPPLYYWITTLPIKSFGSNEWSLRSTSAILGLFGCLFVYWLGLKLYNRRVGLLAGFILATSVLYCVMSHFVGPDLALSLFLTVCLGCFILGARQPPGKLRLGYFLVMYSFAALATLTKGLIGFVLPGFIILVWIIFFNQWRYLKSYYLFSGTLLFLIIAAPWHILMQLEHPDFFQFYFIDQHFLRYLTDYANRGKPPWFLSAAVIVGFFPWIWFLLTAPTYWFCSAHRISSTTPIIKTVKQFWQNRNQFKETIFLILWSGLIFLFFSASNSQLLSYALPILPPLAILTGCYLDSLWENDYAISLKLAFVGILVSGIGMGIGGLLAVHPVETSLRSANYWYASSIILALTMMLTGLFYWKKGLKIGLFALGIGAGLTLVSINLSYETLDRRPVKPLALRLIPLLTPDSLVISYRDYYQDLPVYLNRYIQIVDYQGELAFGITHQDTYPSVIWDKATAWKRWQADSRMFMIMGLEDYRTVIDQPHPPLLYPLGQTTKNILLTNHPL